MANNQKNPRGVLSVTRAATRRDGHYAQCEKLHRKHITEYSAVLRELFLHQYNSMLQREFAVHEQLIPE